MDAEIIEPGRDGRWEETVSVHPQANAFHRAGWARVLSRTYGHKPIYLRQQLSGDAFALTPLMEVRSIVTGRRGVCLPFSDVCEPLVVGSAEGSDLTPGYRQIAQERGWKSFEIRGRQGLPADVEPSEVFAGHQLDLHGSEESLLGGFDSAVRRALRKGEKAGLELRVEASRGAIAAYYRLHEITRRRHGAPPQPYAFFENICEEMIERGLGFVTSAYLDGKVIAAAVFLQSGANGAYKFGASDLTFQEYRASNAAMWAGIKELRRRGAASLCFGRTAESNEGLRRFKTGWGARETKIEYFKFDMAKNTWTGRQGPREGGRAAVIFQRMPLVINRLAGVMIYPHLD